MRRFFVFTGELAINATNCMTDSANHVIDEESVKEKSTSFMKLEKIKSTKISSINAGINFPRSKLKISYKQTEFCA